MKMKSWNDNDNETINYGEKSIMKTEGKWRMTNEGWKA